MQLRSGRFYIPAARAHAQFLAVIDDIKSEYKEEYHSEFNGTDLLYYLRRREEIYETIPTYEAFCALARACRENGLPSVQGRVATELEYCLILDTNHMDMGREIFRFMDVDHRQKWDNYRSFLHNKLFAHTENGMRMRFGVAEERLRHATRKAKENFNNEDLVNFFERCEGFRYIYACEGEDSIFMKFCHYLVSIGYSSINPKEINLNNLAELVPVCAMHHIHFLRPFGLSLGFRMSKAVKQFEDMLDNLDENIERLESREKSDEPYFSLEEIDRNKEDLEDYREQKRDRRFAFRQYLVNGGFRWIADYSDFDKLISMLKAKNLIVDIDYFMILTARMLYISKRRYEHDKGEFSFMPHLGYDAEGEAGGTYFSGELPPRNYVLAYQGPEIAVTSPNTTLVRR